MKKLFLVLAGIVLVGSVYAQTGTALGSPLATVKLHKTEIITDKSFRDDIAKVEKLRGTALTEAERKSFLDDVINDILFFQFCAKEGIIVTDAEIESYIKQVKAQLGPTVTNEQFEAYLASQGIPIADLRTYYRKQMLVIRWLQRDKASEIAAMPPISGADVLKVYELNKAKLIRPDTAKIAFLFVEKKGDDIAKAANDIKGLVTRLEKGESFDAIRLGASATSFYNASREYIYFEKSDLYHQQFGDKFYETVFSLKDGSYSAPFENEVGWWIIRRVEFYPQKTLELSDPVKLGQTVTVEAYLSQQLAQQRESEFIQKAFAELFAKLRAQAEIKITGKP